jgi:hypothetical protein
MHTGKPLSEQSVLIEVSMSILISMIFIGSIGNILSIAVFAQKEPRKVGCGYYLLAISIFNQLTLLLLGARFMYIGTTQMTVWKDIVRSLIVCQCLEFGLSCISTVSSWLSACVSVERTVAVARGVLFNQQTSVHAAKYFCTILLILFAIMNIHIPFTRQLVADPRLGRFTWCVPQYSSPKLQTFTSIISSIQLLGPFITNFLSSGLLIKIITRQKFTLQKNKRKNAYATALSKQIALFKHLIISPIVLLILTLPRLIIFFGSLCMSTRWHNYLFLTGYFISFMPFVTTLLIFVLPSPNYRHEMQLVISRVRHFLLH